MLKPDWKTAPSWAQYLAQDPNGGWWWFEVAPRPASMGWIVCQLGTRCERATIPGEWRKSLTVRGAPSGRVEPALESPLYSQAAHSLITRPTE